MVHFQDIRNRSIRLTDERLQHMETAHPEMAGQIARITETLADPDRIVRSRTDTTVELFYRWYASTPVTAKFLCVVVKALPDDLFMITAYHTDAVKRGEILWVKT
jgi:phage-Barnase-EndoU-ColicinE5/D-RelE like nuclease2